MMATPYSRLITVVLGLGVLASPGHAQTSGQAELNRLLAAIPDSQARRFWQTASQSSGLASVIARLLSNEKPLTTRPTTGVAFPRQELRPPRMGDSTLADVRPFSITPISAYRGAYAVTSVEPGHVTGTLDGIAAPFEVFFKLPQNRQVSSVRSGTRLQLQLLDDSYGMSRHRTVFLTSDTGTPLLLYYSDGGATPHRATLDDLHLRISQQDDGGGRSTVGVSLGGQSANGLRPSQRAVISWQGRRFEVVVLEAVAGDGRNHEIEGDRYHVTVLVYAVP